MGLDLRKVRCFAAVAEHLNFGHVAEALHIAPCAVRVADSRNQPATGWHV
jgi:DNA-binding transcriptional LysR family regulator